MAIDPTTVFNAVAAPSGTAFLDQYHDVLGALIDTSVLRLASVAGSDTITATAEPFEVASTGLVSGMKFTLEPVANNTGAATLNIDGRGAQSIVAGDGSTLAPDALVAGTRYLLEFDGTNFVLLGATGGGGVAQASRTIYDTTAVWSNGLPAETVVMVELWGAGGGGGTGSTNNSAGGGGEYATAIYRAGDLASSVTVTIPAGASTNTDGGSATFGALLEAVGGKKGTNFGGGGQGGAGGGLGGGAGGTGNQDPDNKGGDAGTIHAGGGGGSNDDLNGSADGGDAVFGGGGGGGQGSGNGGSSKYGGAGGDNGNAGQRPGGGGGRNSTGGAGRCIITIFGG